ncbi:Putative Single-stranded DNA-binding protein [Rhizopus microsporus]|nr:Putative Single-stranded DNA-binding protein [Rhizopus microsporus]
MSAFLRQTSFSYKLTRSFSSSAARRDLNKIQLIGRVGSDPISTELSDNRRVYNYTLATSETRPGKDASLSAHNGIVLSIGQTVIGFPSHNSDLVYVEGALRYADYVDKEGIGRTKAEITQTSFRLLNPSRPKEEEEQE